MPIPTEPIGSIPRPIALVQALQANQGSDIGLDALFDAAVADTVARFEATGSPVVTDGEQRKFHNFWTYCVHGLPNLGADGLRIPFAAGHTRRMPRLREGPFRYHQRADLFLEAALRLTSLPVKQAVISPSALSLLYPDEEIAGYPRDRFLDDLLHEHENEVRRCLDQGAHCVQIDLTEGRSACAAEHPAGQSRAMPLVDVDLRGVKVLVVDDEPDARELICQLLVECHAEVHTAGSAREALAELQEFRPDLLLSDIGMPERDGYQLIRDVRQLTPEMGG